MKKLSVVEKAPTFFVVMSICIRKTMNTKIKLSCRVFFTKKTVPVQHILNSGSFFQYSKAQSPKKFCGDRKNKNWSKIKKTSLKGQLSRRGIFITKLSTPKMLTVLLSKYRQSWPKEEQAISYPFTDELRNLYVLQIIRFLPTKIWRYNFWPILIYHFWIESTAFMLMQLLKQFPSISTSYWLFIVLWTQ